VVHLIRTKAVHLVRTKAVHLIRIVTMTQALIDHSLLLAAAAAVLVKGAYISEECA